MKYGNFFCHIECINIVNLYLLWAIQITLFFIVLAGAWERGDMHFNLHVCTGKCRERTDCFSFRIRPDQFCFGKEKRKPRIEKDLLGFWVQSSASAVSQIPNIFHNRLCYSKICFFPPCHLSYPPNFLLYLGICSRISFFW